MYRVEATGRQEITASGGGGGIGETYTSTLKGLYPSLRFIDTSTTNRISFSLLGANLYIPITNGSDVWQRYAGSINTGSGNWFINGYNPSAKFHIRGGGSTNTSKSFFVVNSSDVTSLAVFDDGTIQAPNLATTRPTTVGELYQDTAANILANGDKVIGIRQ